MPMVLFTRILSGGQSGVDRAALDAALARNVPCSGWCPRGRRAEDGPIDQRYPLAETPGRNYPQRTEWNVRDSDGTLILVQGSPDRGTALTIKLAARLQKACLVLDLSGRQLVEKVLCWAQRNHVRVLNVAGPRESKNPGIYERAFQFLRKLLAFSELKELPGRRPKRIGSQKSRREQGVHHDHQRQRSG